MGKLNGFAFLAAVLSFGVTHILESKLAVSLMIFCFAAILLDMAVSGNLVLSQQVIYGLGDEIRGRVNGIFMAVFFVGGAIGSGWLDSCIYDWNGNASGSISILSDGEKRKRRYSCLMQRAALASLQEEFPQNIGKIRSVYRDI